MRNPSSHRGFTLVELMVVLAIAVILVGLALPSFVVIMANNRASSAASALQQSLNLARSEAVKRGSNASVVVAPNTAAGAWQNGWKVFLNNSGVAANSLVAPAAGTAVLIILEEVAPLPATVVPTTAGAFPLGYFIFDGRGRLVDTAGNVADRSISFADGTDSNRYCLILSASGRARTEKLGNASACGVG